MIHIVHYFLEKKIVLEINIVIIDYFHGTKNAPSNGMAIAK